MKKKIKLVYTNEKFNAGFFLRSFAFAVDFILSLFFAVFVIKVILPLFPQVKRDFFYFNSRFIGYLFFFLIYNVFLIKYFGRTIGKMVTLKSLFHRPLFGNL
jgi:hypothetical protein